MADAPVVPLREVLPDERRQRTIVEILKGLLARAEAGEIHDLMLVLRAADNEFTVQWVLYGSVTEKVGALERLKFDILRDIER